MSKIGRIIKGTERNIKTKVKRKIRNIRIIKKENLKGM